MNSIWTETSRSTNYKKIKENSSTQVCIIGAGITGITLAYLLNKKGIPFILLEKDELCSGVTANTTGKITSQHGLIYNYLANSYGKETAIKYLNANENAIHSIKKIIDDENIDCNFEWQDSFVYTNSEEELKKIYTEVETLNSLGYSASFVDNIQLPFKTLGGICFHKQAQMHARKYCIGLANTLPVDQVYEHSKVIDIKKKNNAYETICENGVIVNSKYVVIATHYPIINFPGMYFTKMYQDKSYLIAVDTKTDLFEGMYISQEEPVTSFRTVNLDGKRLLLVGGSGHKTGDTNIDIKSCYKNLENYVKSIYPHSEVLYRWSTEDCVTLDKIPYIGQFSNLWPNAFVATGYKKWGMTSSYVAADIIFNEIIGNSIVEADIFKATRMNPIKNRKELGNILKQTGYSLILNKVKCPELSIDDLKIGDGGVVSDNGKKIGVYKKSEDEVYIVKPYCTHLGCELSWNALEKTWDCPCHGSRYSYKGELLTEPSRINLKKL